MMKVNLYEKKSDRTTTCWSCQDRRGLDALGTSGVEDYAESGWTASAKTSKSLDDKIVTEIRTKLEADGKL